MTVKGDVMALAGLVNRPSQRRYRFGGYVQRRQDGGGVKRYQDGGQAGQAGQAGSAQTPSFFSPTGVPMNAAGVAMTKEEYPWSQSSGSEGTWFPNDPRFFQDPSASALYQDAGQAPPPGRMTTNNWRLLPAPYQSPQYVMRNGAIIDRFRTGREYYPEKPTFFNYTGGELAPVSIGSPWAGYGQFWPGAVYGGRYATQSALTTKHGGSVARRQDGGGIRPGAQGDMSDVSNPPPALFSAESIAPTDGISRADLESPMAYLQEGWEPRDTGGYFTINQLYAGAGRQLPGQFSQGSDRRSTNNWRLTGGGPGTIMRNGRVINVGEGRRMMNASPDPWYEKPVSGGAFGYPVVMQRGGWGKQGYGFWPGQSVDTWANLGAGYRHGGSVQR